MAGGAGWRAAVSMLKEMLVGAHSDIQNMETSDQSLEERCYPVLCQVMLTLLNVSPEMLG